jgi:hypothetical protein
MKADIELEFKVIINDEEVLKTIKLTNIGMCYELFEDFTTFYNGKFCKINMIASDIK